MITSYSGHAAKGMSIPPVGPEPSGPCPRRASKATNTYRNEPEQMGVRLRNVAKEPIDPSAITRVRPKPSVARGRPAIPARATTSLATAARTKIAGLTAPPWLRACTRSRPAAPTNRAPQMLPSPRSGRNTGVGWHGSRIRRNSSGWLYLHSLAEASGCTDGKRACRRSVTRPALRSWARVVATVHR